MISVSAPHVSHRLVQRLDVPDRLRHLLAAQPQHAVVRPHLRERPPARLGLRDLVLVVREDQIAPASVQRELATQPPLRHRRALDVPARPSPPPRRLPPGVLTGLVALPEREVERIALVLARLRRPGSLQQLVDALVAEHPVAVEAAHREVHVAAGLVGVPARDQLLDQRHDLGHRLARQRLAVGPSQAQQVGVGDVGLGHLARQRVRRHALVDGRRVDLVVDVGDVLDQQHRLPAPLQVALHQLEHHERPRVSDVDAVVDGGPAHVHADRAVGARLQLAQLARQRVADPHAARLIASSRGSAASTAHSSGPRSRPVSVIRASRSGTPALRSSSTSARASCSDSRSG